MIKTEKIYAAALQYAESQAGNTKMGLEPITPDNGFLEGAKWAIKSLEETYAEIEQIKSSLAEAREKAFSLDVENFTLRQQRDWFKVKNEETEQRLIDKDKAYQGAHQVVSTALDRIKKVEAEANLQRSRVEAIHTTVKQATGLMEAGFIITAHELLKRTAKSDPFTGLPGYGEEQTPNP